jgi:pimeloyl-ACP methyl ester carboxylesterase
MLPATAGPLDTIRAMDAASRPVAALDTRIRAQASDLPAGVAAALANPPAPRIRTTRAGGYRFSSRSWGDPAGQALLLVHGVTSSSATWWRVGPALAAAGHLVIAPDLPGHGKTTGSRGRHLFAETAADLRAFCCAIELDAQHLDVVGHSWGAMVSAALPAAGLVPRTLVLIDPPSLPREFFERYIEDPEEQPYADIPAAKAAIGAANPTWSDGDVEAKAEGLTEFDVGAARAVVLENTFDGGLAALADPAAADVPVWYIRGEFAHGSLVPESVVPALAARAGADHVLTIAEGPHSPQRTHPEATVVAILRAIAG